MLGGISIKNYYNKINEIIVSTLHMINVYKNNKSLTNTYGDLPLGTRITTIGMYDEIEKEDKMFFSLDNVSDVVYYYAYNKDRLETDSKLMTIIKENIEQNKSENIRATYGVYETDYEQDYVYSLYHTSEIQQ
jgi:ribosome biogenesis SPOUT family RNA methylase Rps3